MQYRELGRTGWKVSTLSFGAWAIGGTWGAVDDSESLAALQRAVELGVNFFDTADVYGDGRSERLLARLRRQARRADRHRHQSRAAAGSAHSRGLQPPQPDRLRGAQPEEPGDGYPGSAATALPANAGLLPAGGLRRAGRPGAGGQAALLRGERGESGRSAQGDRVPQRAKRADHLQHVPPATGGAVLRAGAEAQGGHPGARAAGFRAADRQAEGRQPPSQRTTTGRSTARANPSTAARPSPAWITRPGCKRWRS